MNCDDYEIIKCPTCKSKLRISYSVDVDVDIDVEKEEKDASYPPFFLSDLREAPAFIVDTSTIPFTGDQTEYFPPVIYNVWEWWLNNRTLWCGRPLSVMHRNFNTTPPESIAALIDRHTGDLVRCTPERADDYRVLMRWNESVGATLRSTVEICARRWLDGQWFVQRKLDRAGLPRDSFSYWVDGQVVCISMGFLNEEQVGEV